MQFRFNHFNFNVLDLGRSLDFYREALGFAEMRRKEGENFTLAYLGDGVSDFTLELTWMHQRTERYDLGEDEFHLAVTVADYEAAHRLHQQMGCICYENPEMGIYFIEDPDGYWIEIVPEKG